MKKILDEYHDYIGISAYDDFICGKINLKCYCIIPMMFEQKRSFESTIETNDGSEYLYKIFK